MNRSKKRRQSERLTVSLFPFLAVFFDAFFLSSCFNASTDIRALGLLLFTVFASASLETNGLLRGLITIGAGLDRLLGFSLPPECILKISCGFRTGVGSATTGAATTGVAETGTSAIGDSTTGAAILSRIAVTASDRMNNTGFFGSLRRLTGTTGWSVVLRAATALAAPALAATTFFGID